MAKVTQERIDRAAAHLRIRLERVAAIDQTTKTSRNVRKRLIRHYRHG